MIQFWYPILHFSHMKTWCVTKCFLTIQVIEDVFTNLYIINKAQYEFPSLSLSLALWCLVVYRLIGVRSHLSLKFVHGKIYKMPSKDQLSILPCKLGTYMSCLHK